MTTLHLSRLRRLSAWQRERTSRTCVLRRRARDMEWRTVAVIVLVVSLCFFIVPIRIGPDKAAEDAELFAKYVARYNKSYRDDLTEYNERFERFQVNNKTICSAGQIPTVRLKSLRDCIVSLGFNSRLFHVYIFIRCNLNINFIKGFEMIIAYWSHFN